MGPVFDVSSSFSSLLQEKCWQTRPFLGVSSFFAPPPPRPPRHCQADSGAAGEEMLPPGPVMWPRAGGAWSPGGKQGMRAGARRMDGAWRIRKERWGPHSDTG